MAGFFRVLWRINAVLAFGAALLAIVFLTLFSRDRIKQPLLNYFVPQPLVQAVKAPTAYSYSLEPDLFIGASDNQDDFELYRLLRWGNSSAHPGTPDASATVNILVIDKKTGNNTWLFSGYDRVITGQEAMLTGRWYYHEPQVDDDVPVELMVLKVVEADSNGDGFLSNADRQTLYVARFPTGVPEKILTADQIYFTRQQGKEFLVSYRDKAVSYFTTFSLPDFQQVKQTIVKDMPQ
ncbi:MAG: hypothetical protein P4L57_05920 [Rhizomicrobium sp.]|nr:hypothetical protein [Rhizomicrobium sp.]